MGHEGLEPRGRVSGGRDESHDDAGNLLLAPRGEKGRALHVLDPRADAHRAQIVRDGLAHGVVGREGSEVPAVEAARIAGLGEEGLGARGVVGMRRQLERKLERLGHDVAARAREAQPFRLAHRLAVDGQARGQAHALIVPGRLGIALLGEVEPELADRPKRRGDLEARRALELLGHRPRHEIDQVDLPALHRGGARGLVGDGAEDQPLHRGRLAPVALEGLEHHLHAWIERNEAIGAGPDRPLLEALLADLLEVLLRDDPGRSRCRGAVEGHEVRPRLLQHDAHASRVRGLDLLDAILEQLGRRALVALERELHVVGGDRLAVVEVGVLPQHEVVHEPVARHRPGLGEARSRHRARHGLHHCVVEGVEHEKGFRLRGIEPARGQRHVNAPGHGAFGGGGGLSVKDGDEGQDGEQGEADPACVHGVSQAGEYVDGAIM